jgi:hypothetical protein
VWSSPSAKTLVDFGQNLVGRLRFTVRGERGATITIRHAEVLHGFRYAEVQGWPGELTADSLAAVVVHSDLRRIGEFTCSDDVLNQLHRNVEWSLRGNVLDVPTDCPQRDERLGWTGDLAVFAPTAAFLYDVEDFLRDWLADLDAEQRAAGGRVPFAIVFGLLDEPLRQRAGDRLAALVTEADHRIATGFAGTPFVLDALTATGHLDVAYRLLQRECPSWLYPVTMGATTIWERWDSMLPDGSINPGQMTSFNHYALGAVADWMHRVIGGEAPAERRGSRPATDDGQREDVAPQQRHPRNLAGGPWPCPAIVALYSLRRGIVGVPSGGPCIDVPVTLMCTFVVPRPFIWIDPTTMRPLTTMLPLPRVSSRPATFGLYRIPVTSSSPLPVHRWGAALFRSTKTAMSR